MKVAALFSVLIAAACTPTPKQIVVEPTQAHLASTKTPLTLHAVAKDDKGQPVQDVKIAWSSSNTAVATVNATGTVTAVKSGNADIAATAGDIKGVSHMEVEILTSLTLSPDKLALTAPQQTAQLHLVAKDDAGHETPAHSPVWTSSNPSIFTVDNMGNVHAVEVGNATVTVHVGELSASAPVTVSRPAAAAAAKQKAPEKKRHG